MTDEILNADEARVARIDLTGMAGTMLAFKKLEVKRNLPGPPPNEATVCVVLRIDLVWSGEEIDVGAMIVSESHYLFWTHIAQTLRTGYWIVGRLTHGHSAWMLDPLDADEMEAAKLTIAAYNEYLNRREAREATSG